MAPLYCIAQLGTKKWYTKMANNRTVPGDLDALVAGGMRRPEPRLIRCSNSSELGPIGSRHAGRGWCVVCVRRRRRGIVDQMAAAAAAAGGWDGDGGGGGRRQAEVAMRGRAAVLLLDAVTVAAGEEGEQHAGLLEGVGAEVDGLEARPPHPPAPLRRRLVALRPLRRLAADDVPYLAPQVELRHHLLRARTAPLERVEQGGVVVQRLREPLQERPRVVVRLLLHHRHDLRPHRPHRPQHLLQRPRPRQQPVQLEHRVHRHRLRLRAGPLALALVGVEQHVGLEVGEGRGDEAAVAEVDADGLRELGELPADLLERVGAVGLRRADARQAEGGGPAGAEREGLYQRRPLLDHVHAPAPRERLQDRLVRGAALVEVGVEEILSADAVTGAAAAAAAADEEEEQRLWPWPVAGLGEVAGDLAHGAAEGGGEDGDLLHEEVGGLEVLPLDGVGAGHERSTTTTGIGGADGGDDDDDAEELPPAAAADGAAVRIRFRSRPTGSAGGGGGGGGGASDPQTSGLRSKKGSAAVVTVDDSAGSRSGEGSKREEEGRGGAARA
ncbi:hypothetical protein ACMD2_22286 [Ananas comosus]|uniref:Uncharacterized protein n=1 Tax=Ananas comosus TaxID=4615 RepID=A0A199UE69_ANACO|nr:hypothetical protein ACMD2_22286 [Ananas comosus]